MAQAHQSAYPPFPSQWHVRKQQIERKQRMAVTLALAALGATAIGVGVFLSSDDAPDRKDAMNRALVVQP